MNHKQLIKDILYQYPQNFLMAEGGEGMEFMTYLISNHSPKIYGHYN
jgi:hypothetical protein